ncbi:MAG: hypothetical protein GXP42_17795 [Chloroflexi bacterium]|nr:hypothetical protein [Chloroflexota bacterium]
MNNYINWDMLDNYLNTLKHQGEAKAQLIENDPARPAEMDALFRVVQVLWRELRPVAPRADFRTSLGEQLVNEARRRQAREALAASRARPALPRLWLVPVAALGTASLVGAYAYWRFTRQGSPANRVAAA